MDTEPIKMKVEQESDLRKNASSNTVDEESSVFDLIEVIIVIAYKKGKPD